MDVYTFDPHLYLRRIVVVGLGGTGSHLARNLARLLVHCRQNRQSVPELVFVDPDIVEEKNIGRQLFSPVELHQSKAVALARRYNYALGLEINAICEPLNAEKHIGRNDLICGCVDNHHARREIARAEGHTWIDAGNDFDHGQVVIGNNSDWDAVFRGLEYGREKHSSVLPNAGLLFPSLLEAEEQDEVVDTQLSCAELVARGEQHLYINDFMANLVTHYVYQLLNREAVTSFVSFVNLKPYVNVRSVPFTKENLERYR